MTELVNRIFLTLAMVSNGALLATFLLGLNIEDARAISEAGRQQVTMHLLTGIGAAVVALLVHAVSLTYFMGTGRWIEETSAAYRLGDAARRENIRLKYRAIPGMIWCTLAVIVTGALGAIADPASNQPMAAGATIHFVFACVTIASNIGVSGLQYTAIRRNGQVVNEVVAEVHRIRQERGLDPPVPAAVPSATA